MLCCCLATVMSDSSSVHGVSQARILEWVAISFFRGSSRPRDWIHWKVDSLPLSQWCYPPKYKHDAPLNPFMFQLKCHPFVNPLSNSVFLSWESDSSTLTAARMKADILPPGVLLKHFVRLSLASLLPSSDHGLWGNLITIGAAKAESVSKLPSAEIKSERIQENWLFFAFARQMWKWLIPNEK